MSEIETASPISGTLPVEARTVFRLSSAIFYVIGLVITGALVFAAVWFDWPGWLQVTAYGLLAIAVIYSLVDIIVFQKWKQERFTYLVQPLEIRLHHGIITTHDCLDSDDESTIRARQTRTAPSEIRSADDHNRYGCRLT